MGRACRPPHPLVSLEERMPRPSLRASAHGTNGEGTWSYNGTEHGVQSHRHTSIVITATTFTLFEANTKETAQEVASNGCHLCVLALTRVNVVAVTTILVLHVAVIGHHVPCHYHFMFPRRSYHARLRASPNLPDPQFFSETNILQN